MKKNIFIFLFIAGVISVSFLIPKHKTKVELNFDPRHQTEFIHIENETTKAEPTKSEVLRVPAQVSQQEVKNSPPPKRISPQKLEFQYQIDEKLFIAKDIAPIRKKEYKPSHGEVVFSDNFHHFVRQVDGSGKSLALYDAARQRLMPLSNVIKIQADQMRREEIIARGYKEHLYLEHLNLLFVEANTSEFSMVYDNLKKEGYEPEHQVMDRIIEAR